MHLISVTHAASGVGVIRTVLGINLNQLSPKPPGTGSQSIWGSRLLYTDWKKRPQRPPKPFIYNLTDLTYCRKSAEVNVGGCFGLRPDSASPVTSWYVNHTLIPRLMLRNPVSVAESWHEDSDWIMITAISACKRSQCQLNSDSRKLSAAAFSSLSAPWNCLSLTHSLTQPH